MSITLSDSDGTIHDPKGIDADKLAWVMELKNERRGRIQEYAKKYGAEFIPGKKPWSVPGDVALPSATQNEIDGKDADTLLRNGCICVAEGANMPSDPDAVDKFVQARILFGPGKAANAGGVATSGLEMAQNSQRLSWGRDEVDRRLRDIMVTIHETCVRHGKEGDFVNYVKGANIGGFIKVADAMLDQGLV
jgi:glutamate dehydrogenase (NADP+)